MLWARVGYQPTGLVSSFSTDDETALDATGLVDVALLFRILDSVATVGRAATLGGATAILACVALSAEITFFTREGVGDAVPARTRSSATRSAALAIRRGVHSIIAHLLPRHDAVAAVFVAEVECQTLPSRGDACGTRIHRDEGSCICLHARLIGGQVVTAYGGTRVARRATIAGFDLALGGATVAVRSAAVIARLSSLDQLIAARALGGTAAPAGRAGVVALHLAQAIATVEGFSVAVVAAFISLHYQIAAAGGLAGAARLRTDPAWIDAAAVGGTTVLGTFIAIITAFVLLKQAVTAAFDSTQSGAAVPSFSVAVVAFFRRFEDGVAASGRSARSVLHSGRHRSGGNWRGLLRGGDECGCRTRIDADDWVVVAFVRWVVEGVAGEETHPHLQTRQPPYGLVKQPG